MQESLDILVDVLATAISAQDVERLSRRHFAASDVLFELAGLFRLGFHEVAGHVVRVSLGEEVEVAFTELRLRLDGTLKVRMSSVVNTGYSVVVFFAMTLRVCFPWRRGTHGMRGFRSVPMTSMPLTMPFRTILRTELIWRCPSRRCQVLTSARDVVKPFATSAARSGIGPGSADGSVMRASDVRYVHASGM